MRLISLVFVSFLCVGCGDASPTAPSIPAAQSPQLQTPGESVTNITLRSGATQMQVVAQAQSNTCYKFSVVAAEKTIADETLGTCAQASARFYEKIHPVAALQVQIRITPLENQLPQLTWWIVSE